ncbi:MAG: hypothetical protein RLZZ15_2074, partial [Verrucomicrobiota bacterium]
AAAALAQSGVSTLGSTTVLVGGATNASTQISVSPGGLNVTAGGVNVSITPPASTPVTTTATPATPAVTAPVTLPPATVPPRGAAEQPASTGETSLTLDITSGIRAVPPARVTVPVGETVRVTYPAGGTRPVQWFKDSRPLTGVTANPLVLSRVTAADAGAYTVIPIDPLGLPVPSQTLLLAIGPATRLLNLSARATLAAGAGQTFITGFVVSGLGTQEKKIILRAVGPTLNAFGVTTPLRAPVLRVFDSAGKPYVNGYVYPAVVGGPTYETDLAESLAKTGAFAIPAGTLDATLMMPFPTGAYTAHVTSGDNTAGNVLLEIYEVP